MIRPEECIHCGEFKCEECGSPPPPLEFLISLLAILLFVAVAVVLK